MKLYEGDKLIAPGVKHSEWCSSDRYEGTKEALIAAKIAEPHWFEDLSQKWRGGKIKRTKYLTVNGRHVETTVPAQGYCTVTVRCTPEEEQERRARDERERERQREIALLDAEPKAPDQYRERCRQDAILALSQVQYAVGFRSARGASKEPFRFDDDTIRSIREHLAEIVDLIDEGGIVKLREPFNVKLLKAATEAQRNVGFQRFMSRLLPSGERGNHAS